MRYRKETGATAVEFALIAPVFFLLIFAIIEFGLLFWVDLTMQHAVREGARFAITGQTNPSPDPNHKRYNDIIATMNKSSMGLWAKVDPEISVTITNGASSTTTVYDDDTPYVDGMFGESGNVITIQLNCRWPPFTGYIRDFFSTGEHGFHVAATMKNEGFTPPPTPKP
ncbi:pilus assembly protein [Uliginosibacterium flavum]